jgi:hypothetical protein
LTQVVKWLYQSLEAELAGRGGTGRDGVRQRERLEEEEWRGPRKRPRSPSPDASGRSTTPQSITAQETSSHGGGRRREIPGRPALEELHAILHRMCQHGDGCPSLRGDGQTCHHLHSADLARLEVSQWIRETALTFMRAHPSADFKPGEYDRFKWRPMETAWKQGFKRVVRQWIDKPELAAMEAPAVPAPHPDAAPSGAPRGVKRSDLLELKGLVQQLCFRGTKHCHFRTRGVCDTVHPGALTTSQPSEWVRDELERITGNHPYQHLTPGVYQVDRSENVERVWKASLIRQVDKWIEWHDSGEGPAQGTGEGPGDTAGGAEGRGGASGMDDAPASSAPGARKRPRSPGAVASGRSTTLGSATAQEKSFIGREGREGESSGNSGGSTREGPGPPALKELLGVMNRICRCGDSCPSLRLRGQKPCPCLHSADIKALEELPVWARETALTFLRAHPSAEHGPGECDRLRSIKKETAWKEGSGRAVSRWVDNPELAATEAPAVPAPHPDAAPSGAPRGVKRRDLLELKDLAERLCFRVTTECLSYARGACKGLHPEDLCRSRASRWVRDELQRLLNSNPHQHPLTCEVVDRAWRAGLIRQVDKWIEWHEAAERGSRSSLPRSPGLP